MEKVTEEQPNNYPPPISNAEAAINHFRQSLASGKHWYQALLETIGLWTDETETIGGQEYHYLIEGEAFDWLLLAELDIVIASVHSAMNQSEEQMTRRVITAIENPHVDILGHPTCRLLGEREPIELNIDAVFQAAIQNNTVLEIDSIPSRLDLKDTHIYQAREMGIKLVIDTDSHRLEHLDYMHFGIGTARRGWCEAKDVLNTLPLNEFKASLKH